MNEQRAQECVCCVCGGRNKSAGWGVIEISVAKNLSFGNVRVNHSAQYVSGGFFLFFYCYSDCHTRTRVSYTPSLTLSLSLTHALPISRRRYQLFPSLAPDRLSTFGQPSVLLTEQPRPSTDRRRFIIFISLLFTAFFILLVRVWPCDSTLYTVLYTYT